MMGECRLGIFDVDGTVTESAQVMSKEMAEVLNCSQQTLAFISGTDYRELVRMLQPLTDLTDEFFILPEMGISCYSKGLLLYDCGYMVPDDLFAKIKIYGALAMDELGLLPVADDVFLRRHSQITISILGRSAPPSMKQAVDSSGSIRRKIIHRITELMKYNGEEIPFFTLGGSSSIDIQMTAWDKYDGVTTLLKYFGLEPHQAIYFGDHIHPGGNDWPVTHTGVRYVEVTCPADTLAKLKYARSITP